MNEASSHEVRFLNNISMTPFNLSSLDFGLRRGLSTLSVAQEVTFAEEAEIVICGHQGEVLYQGWWIV